MCRLSGALQENSEGHILPAPRRDEAKNCLVGSAVFSSLDLRN